LTLAVSQLSEEEWTGHNRNEELQACLKSVVHIQVIGESCPEQIASLLNSNDLMPPTQSAYRKFYSTETAESKVYNDLLLAADEGQVSALCLLDLTAAFNTVDHELLLLCLSVS